MSTQQTVKIQLVRSPIGTKVSTPNVAWVGALALDLARRLVVAIKGRSHVRVDITRLVSKAVKCRCSAVYPSGVSSRKR